MKKTVILSVAAILTMFVQVVGIGPAAAEPDAAAQPQQVLIGCTAWGIGSSNAYAVCDNDTNYARLAHFHVDCWAVGDSDTDQDRWVGAYGSVTFHHWCWSWVQNIEAYFL
jgi:hypothetical protein